MKSYDAQTYLYIVQTVILNLLHETTKGNVRLEAIEKKRHFEIKLAEMDDTVNRSHSKQHSGA
jgi:hypothetical protein